MNSLLQHLPRLSSIISTSLLLGACATPLPQTEPPAAEQPSHSTVESDSQALGSFQGATVYALLVAEIASQRGMPQITLQNYLREAERTRDLNITRHATGLAQHYNDPNALLKASLLWHELEPNNPTPGNLAAAVLIRQGDIERAKPLLKNALQQDSLSTIDALVERSQKMNSDERATYLEVIDQLLAQQPEQARLLYAKASLLRHNPHQPGANRDENQALKLAQEALSLDPTFDRAILLEADLQARSGHLDTALGHLREELNRRDHKQMRTLYTRLLLQKGQTEAATKQAELLIANHPDDHNLKFYLGALMLENEQIDASESYLTQLSDKVGTNSTLHYYFGRIAQIREQREKALEHYSQIGKSAYLVAAMAEVTKLLDKAEDEIQLRRILNNARSKYPAKAATLFALEAHWLTENARKREALSVYNQGLQQHPEDTQLLYNRAMLSEQLDDLTQMEQDLRQLLELEPNNATALNALGYSLTDRTDRHAEALELIRQALKLKPDDPAILDSMGWAHFNLGDYRLALEYLLRAYETFPDPEIASHLGQVYWKLGQPEQARQIWNEALERNPDSPLILDAMRQAEQQ